MPGSQHLLRDAVVVSHLVLQAVIKRYGAWEVDDAPPVFVKVQEVAGAAAPGTSTSSDPGAAGSNKVGSITISVTGKHYDQGSLSCL